VSEISEFDLKLYQFLKKHSITWDDKKKKWSKPFQPVTKNIWVKSDKGGFNPEKNENGYWETTFSHWKLGRLKMKLSKCFYCFKDLNGKQEKFCSHKCRVLTFQIRKRAEELVASIWHSEKRFNGHLQFPEWKDFNVRSQDRTTKPLTMKNYQVSQPNMS